MVWNESRMYRKRIAWGLMTLASLTIVLVVSRYLGQPLASRRSTRSEGRSHL